MWTLPNILTLLRVALLPVLVALFMLPQSWAAWLALLVYTVAALTDYFDGYLARTTQQITAIGKFLDPIADKIFVGCLLLLIAMEHRLPDWWIVPALVIMAREILISGLREYLGPYNIQLPVSRLAKWKTAFQMIALGFLIIGPYGDVIVPQCLLIGQILLSIAAILTVWTGWAYMRVGLRHMIASTD
ncbi:MAG: CDP-diacylglycerol--glycerol-3-phosphate 3-phosphatidyltransferase [Pseudomonadota bacterium]